MAASTPSRNSSGRPDGRAQEPIGSRFVRALLVRHQVPPERHVTTVAQVLGWAYTPAYRRMMGTVAWELEEVEQLGAHFGETLAQVFAPPAVADEVQAILVAGSARVSCQLVPGHLLREPAGNSLVAIRLGGTWMVLPAGEAGDEPRHEVRAMTITAAAERRWRIAVMDDDAQETASLADHFTDRGCNVAAFTRVEDLVQEMRGRRFDGYVIDWVLAEGTAGELVAMIRTEDASCPIAVLTGKIGGDVLIEPAVAEAVSTYGLLFFEKPTRLPIISAQLLGALGGR